ncbi:hypothetical protein GUJ93_ZPchr0006g42798 [Zizania palustris]|uniref:Uncharacterized protein n=1 Tax=Zizania palustris TaxID=103762 RepID=A0A8J5W249_ZIZPA|nr:hypothetical protein GUJ93_ZPchr0006g42798 [Zizania palustris]
MATHCKGHEKKDNLSWKGLTQLTRAGASWSGIKRGPHEWGGVAVINSTFEVKQTRDKEQAIPVDERSRFVRPTGQSPASTTISGHHVADSSSSENTNVLVYHNCRSTPP